MHRKRFAALLLTLLCAPIAHILCALGAHAAEAPRTLQVVTRSVPPFAFQDDAGKWQGIAIELWERTIAELGMRAEYRTASLAEMLDAVATGRADAAVGALSVTAEREDRFDFTHPFFRAGLGVAVHADTMSWWDRIVDGLGSRVFLATLASLVGLLALVGAIVWLFERRRNTQFPRDPVRGIGAGMWFSSVTMTTVGYGDKAPLTFGGRLTAVIWMFASVILVSIITASLTATLTLEALSGNVRTEDDLRRARTGTIVNTTSEARLKRKGVRHRTYPNLKAAMTALAAKELDAVVYDQPLLKYMAKNEFAEAISVLPLTFEPQDYAIGLPTGSALRKAVNRGLLRHGQGPEWEALLARYLGSNESQP